MSALSIQVPFPVFQGRDGQPLENGYVWIGEPNLNPQTNPVVAYYDRALTIVAAQPLRTLNGFISRAGTPAQVYVSGANFSILVQDSKGSMVYNFPDGSGVSADTVSVKDFGAVGDGVTNDTVAIQNALNAVGVTGGALLLNEGTYLVTTLSIPANVTFYGNSWNAVIKSIPAGSVDFIVIDNASNTTIKGIAFDMSNNPGADGNGAVCIVLKSTSTPTNNTTITRCKFTNANIRPFIDVRTQISCANLFVTYNEFYGQPALIPKPAPSSQNTAGIRILSAPFKNIVIDNNYFDRTQNATQIRPQYGGSISAKRYDTYVGLSWSDNVVTNILDDSNVGDTPLELFGATNAVIDGNRIDSGGRGLCASWVKNAVYNNNTISNQTIYFIEVQSSDGITVSNNTALNCKTFLNVTGVSADPGTINVEIVGNVVKGGNLGIPGLNTDTNAFTIRMTANSATPHANWNICGNLFSDNIFTGQLPGSVGAGSVIRVDGVGLENFNISENVFVSNDDRAGASYITVASGKNIKVSSNSIIRGANITSNTYDVLSTPISFITVVGNVNNTDLILQNNFVKFTGTDTRVGSTGNIGIGNFSGAQALPGAQFIGNTIIGTYLNSLFLQYTSNDIVVEDNNLDQAVGAPLYNAAIVFRRNRKIANGTAIPTVGNWARGDVIFNSNATVGQPVGWSCTVSGTPGTWVAWANL
jgi:parallel beta-helix repeat protein